MELKYNNLNVKIVWARDFNLLNVFIGIEFKNESQKLFLYERALIIKKIRLYMTFSSLILFEPKATI